MEFNKEYYFLSNSYQYPFDLDINGKTYRFACADAAFLACKAPIRASEFQGLTSKQAKDIKLKKKEIREDFDKVKLNEMKRVLRAKFSERTLQNKLLAIQEPILMENSYHDTYWGIYNGKGQNILGTMLQEIRKEILMEKGITMDTIKKKPLYKIQFGGTICFDTETTGLSDKYDEILQISIVGQDGATLLSTYVKPAHTKSWDEAMAVNHITPEMVKDAPTVEEVAKAVKYIFSNADTIVGYNVGFDMRMTKANFGYDFSKNHIVDALKLFREYDNKMSIPKRGHKLINAVEEFCPELAGKFETEAHDALADTKVTMEVAKKLCNLMDVELPLSKMENDGRLFYLDEGIICHQTNTLGITEGFSTRLVEKYPIIKKNMKNLIHNSIENKENIYGAIQKIDITENLSLANIYTDKGHNNTDINLLTDRITRICKKFPDKNVYIPVVSKPNETPIEIVDGLGIQEGKWKDVEKALMQINEPNLKCVDTQTGIVFSLKDRIVSKDNKDKDEDFEIG